MLIEKLILEFREYGQSIKNYSIHTLNAYHDDLNEFQDFLKEEHEGISVEEISSSIIRQYMAMLNQKGLNPKSIQRKIASTSAFFKYLQKRNIIASSPTAAIQKPKAAKSLVSDIPEKDLEKLFLDQLPETFEEMRDYTLIMTLYCTGIRRSELIALTPESIVNGKQHLKVLGKRNKERIIPLLPKLVELIDKYMIMRDKEFCDKENFIFLSKKGKKMTFTLVYQIVHKYLSGVTSTAVKSPHTLRHSFATHMLNRGADIMAIKELLGHSSLAATQVYTHNAVEKLKKVYNHAHPRGD